MTVTASVPLWIVSAGSDMSGEDLQTTVPVILKLPVNAAGQFEVRREEGEGGGSEAAHHVN